MNRGDLPWSSWRSWRSWRENILVAAEGQTGFIGVHPSAPLRARPEPVEGTGSAVGCQLYKQTQFGQGRGPSGQESGTPRERLVASPRLRGDDIPTNRASAPNKPNLQTGRRNDKCRVDNELRRTECGRGHEETKPISGSRPGRPWYSWARRPCYGTPCGVTTSRASAPNKPNFGAGQMKGKCRANKELRSMGCGSGPGKTKPIRSGGGYQGTAARPPAPELWAVVQTNPISGSRSGRPWYSWQDAHVTERLAASLRTGLLRQTNPILARAIWRISFVRTRSCDQSDARAASEKQSQFPRPVRHRKVGVT